MPHETVTFSPSETSNRNTSVDYKRIREDASNRASRNIGNQQHWRDLSMLRDPARRRRIARARRAILDALEHGAPMPEQFLDLAMHGAWSDCRYCYLEGQPIGPNWGQSKIQPIGQKEEGRPKPPFADKSLLSVSGDDNAFPGFKVYREYGLVAAPLRDIHHSGFLIHRKQLG